MRPIRLVIKPIVLLLLCSPVHAALTDGLAGAWIFNGNGNDGTANADTLTNNGSATFSTTAKPVYGTTLASASSQYWSHASNSTLQTGSGDFTVCIWINFSGGLAGNTIMVGKDDATLGRDLTLDQSGGTPRFYTDGGGLGFASSGTTMSTGTWYFIAAWYDHTAKKYNIQVNNGTVAQASYTGTTPNQGTSQFCIGARTYSGAQGYVDATIGEVLYYHRLLTAAELTFLYNGGAGKQFPLGTQLFMRWHGKNLPTWHPVFHAETIE